MRDLIKHIQEDLFQPANQEEVSRRKEVYLTPPKLGDKVSVDMGGVRIKDVVIAMGLGGNNYKVILEDGQVVIVFPDQVERIMNEDMFAPATEEEIEQRSGQYAHQKYLEKQKRAEATRVRYAALPYTYEDITKLPEYQQIMSLPVQDTTGPIQKKHITTVFRLTWGKPRSYRKADAYGYVSTYRDRGYKDYAVFSNGYVRYYTTTMFQDGVSAVLKKFPPFDTTEKYAAALSFLYPIMKSKLDKELKMRNESVNEEEDEELFKAATPEEIENRRWSISYKSLEDVYGKGSTEIWYVKKDSNCAFTDYGLTVKLGCAPNPKNLEKNHIHLGNVPFTDPEEIYIKMQGEKWSPNGEGRQLIRSKGLAHTSMSVGDVIRYSNGKTLYTNMSGFEDITHITDETIESVNEEDMFKAATPADLTKRREDRIKSMGPKLGQVHQLIRDIKELEKEYDGILEHYGYHHDRDNKDPGYDGDHERRISFNIKINAGFNDKLSAFAEEHGLENALEDYYFEMLNMELSDFVGSERVWNKNASKYELRNTGFGLMEEYPDLIEYWTQSGSSGGWLTLILEVLDFDSFYTISDEMVNFENIGIESPNPAEIEYALDFCTGLKTKLSERILQIKEVANKVDKGRKAVEKYFESDQFANDFMESYADTIEYRKLKAKGEEE